MEDFIQLLTCFLKFNKLSVFLMYSGNWLYALAALHLKLLAVMSNFGCPSCLIWPLCASLVLLFPYSVLNMQWSALGFFVCMTLYTWSTEWYTTSWWTMNQPHWFRRTEVLVLGPPNRGFFSHEGCSVVPRSHEGCSVVPRSHDRN